MWNLFDQIVVTANLATGSAGGFRLQHEADSEYRGRIFSPAYLLETEGTYRGYPFRSLQAKIIGVVSAITCLFISIW